MDTRRHFLKVSAGLLGISAPLTAATLKASTATAVRPGHYPTGYKSLDSLLGGGFRYGNVTQIRRCSVDLNKEAMLARNDMAFLNDLKTLYPRNVTSSGRTADRLPACLAISHLELPFSLRQHLYEAMYKPKPILELRKIAGQHQLAILVEGFQWESPSYADSELVIIDSLVKVERNRYGLDSHRQKDGAGLYCTSEAIFNLPAAPWRKTIVAEF